MPIYEYHCLVCNRDFEKLVMTSTAETAVVCTNCGSELLEKKFSLFGSKVGERASPFAPSGGEGGGSCGCGSCTCH
jgi:putative FmdB family regulatory protein